MRAEAVRPRWWWYLPVALLIGVACRQVQLVRGAALVPWSGGGFGMFSTTDGWGTREVRLVAVRPDVRRELEVPADLRKATRRIRAFPSAARARQLALAVAGLPSPDAGRLAAIEVEVWAADHDAVTLRRTARLVRSFRVPFGAE